MKLLKHLTKVTSFAITLGVMAGTTPAHAAPLNISDVPLFIDSGVDPNILLAIDDSGSMRWLMLPSVGARVAHPTDTDRIIESFTTVEYGGETAMNYTPDSDIEARRLCAGYNVLAYDPTRTYTPWAGKDKNGTTYANASIGGGLKDPYDGIVSSSNKVSLIDHVYMTWVDSDNDDVFDSGECGDLPTQDVITTHEGWVCNADDHDLKWSSRSSAYYCDPPGRNNNYWAVWGTYTTTETMYTTQACRDDAQCTVVADLNATQKTNYANWYSYYRKRDFVAKKATLALIESSSARMGLGTMLNRNSVGTEIKDMDDGDSSTTQDATDKRSLMAKVGQILPSTNGGGTPTRRTLNNAGKYFDSGDDDLFSHLSGVTTPILSASEGGQCQQNFTILLSDGYANGSSPNVDNRDMDGGTGENNTIYDGGVYADDVSDTLADVAMKYYEEDLSTLTDGVPNSNGGTDKMHQHMITYTVAFGVTGNLTCNPAATSCSDSWPTSLNEGADTIDDMWHAAVNGRGAFLSAANPQDLIDDMQEALDSIDARTSGSAAVAANSTTLNQGTVIYQALFNTGDWHGNLRSLPVSIGATDTRSACANVAAGNVCSAADWNASTRLDGQNYDTGRSILTYNSSSTASKKGIPFRWPSNYSSPGLYDLNSDQINALLGNAQTGQEQAYGQALVNFLRGDQSNESNGFDFRNRSATVLGDIVNSAPAYVGAPAFNFPDSMETNPYSTYKNGSASSRTPIVYVGANDGMLHGFNTTTGDEVIAYVPEAVYGNLENLSEEEYTTQNNHRYFVDGTPTVGDAYFNNSWHTVLLSGLRAGGQSIFALNVTDPTKFNEVQTNINSVVMWEYTDNDLGYTFSQPDIVKLNNGTWAAIFGNGYNNSEADGSASTTGYAYLYIVNLETGALIKKISTQTGSVGTPNGLATATPVDIDGDYVVDYVYAGDLQGNMWRFDLLGNNTSSWDVFKTSGNPTPLFTAKAKESGYPAQPITSRPSVTFHPEVGEDGVMVMFGTGRYIDSVDNVATGQNTQTFYGIWDDLDGGMPPTFTGNRATTDYLKQEIQSEAVVAGSGAVVRISSDHDIDWDQHYGWFIDLVNTGVTPLDNKGEKQTTNSVVRGDRIVFTTLSPNDVACDFGGSSWLMELAIENGGRLSDSPLDINNDGIIDENDEYNSTVISGIQQSGIITEPSIVGSSDDDKEFKLFNSSTGVTITQAESRSKGSKDAVRKSWTEVSQ